MTRSIRLPIAPATAATCGTTSPTNRCGLVRAASNLAGWTCAVFKPSFFLAEKRARLLRWPECIAAEVEA